MLKTGPPLKTTAQLSTRLNLGRLYVAFALIANVFMVMGQTLTLTRSSHLVQIVSLIAHCQVLLNYVSVGFLPSVTLAPSPPYHLFPCRTSADRLWTRLSSSTSPPFKSLFPLLRRHPPHPPPVRPPTPESD